MRGIPSAFPIQALVLRDAMAGRDILARSRTGSGKTLAFAIPIVERLEHSGRSPQALILAPTRELASQVTEEFRAIADVKQLEIAAVYGGVGIGPQAKRARHADVLIATPGRLLDLVERKLRPTRPRAHRACSTRPTACSTWGSCPTSPHPRDVARRSTDDAVLRDARRRDREARGGIHAQRGPAQDQGRAPDGVRGHPPVHRAWRTPTSIRTLVRELAADRGLTLIFTRTKRGADKLARNLKKEGFRAGALHGDMNQNQRERALGHFAAGRSDVLVATDVAARGLDLEHISHVINFDPPGDDKTYVHRVGRTARAGRSGTGITFVTPEQRRDVALMAKALKLDTEFAHAGLAPRPVPARPSTRDRNRSRNRQRSRS